MNADLQTLCSKCGGRGIRVVGNKAVRCSCTRHVLEAVRYKASRLPERLTSNCFEGFDFSFYPSDASPVDGKNTSYLEMARTAFKAAQDFVNSESNAKPEKGLFICGNVGSGKTFLCSAIANALLGSGKDVLFLVVPDLLDEIRASYSPDSGTSEMQLLDTARNISVLILDDLGAHNYTEWTRNKLYSILNYRLNNRLSTVINSNLTLEEIEQFLGERTTSRIVELCDIYRLLTPRDIRHLKNRRRRP